MDGEFDRAHFTAIRDAMARIGVVDVRAFGLRGEDCEHLLSQLGDSAQISIVAR